jgi:hypothetical protein
MKFSSSAKTTLREYLESELQSGRLQDMDYRALNEITIKNVYPLPMIDHIFRLVTVCPSILRKTGSLRLED